MITVHMFDGPSEFVGDGDTCLLCGIKCSPGAGGWCNRINAKVDIPPAGHYVWCRPEDSQILLAEVHES